MRARTGLRIEETARLADQVNGVIRETIPERRTDDVLDNIGLPYSGINLTYSNAGTIGAPTRKSSFSIEGSARQADQHVHQRLAPKAPAAFSRRAVFLSAGDIVTQILNFGTPAPIDVEVTGMNQRGNYLIGERLANQFPTFRAPWMYTFSRPSIIQLYSWKLIGRARSRLGCSLATSRRTCLVSLSSSFQTSPAFWLDPKNGVEYSVAVQEHSIVWTPIRRSRHSDRRKLPGRRASNTWESCTNTQTARPPKSRITTRSR